MTENTYYIKQNVKNFFNISRNLRRETIKCVEILMKMTEREYLFAILASLFIIG